MTPPDRKGGEGGTEGGRSSAASGSGAGDPPPPEDLVAVVGEWASALGKFNMYPDDHPVLSPAAGRLLERLGEALDRRSSFTVEVERRQLLLAGAATDPGNDLLRSLAGRLHGHQVRAVTFRSGITEEELEELLTDLAAEPVRDDPFGLASPDEGWPHVDVDGSRYRPLHLDEDEREERPEPPPVSSRVAGMDLLESEAADVAERVTQRLRDEELEQTVVLQLFRLAERLPEAGEDVADRLRRKMSELILELPSDVIADLLQLFEDLDQEEDFLMATALSAEVEATLKLVHATARRRNDDIAPWLLDLVTKLAQYPETARHDRQSARLNEFIDRLVDTWDLEDPRPTVYRRTLRRLSHTSASESGLPERRTRAIFLGPERVLKMGLELDETTGSLVEAGEQMIRAERFRDLADLLRLAPEDNRLAAELWRKLAVPDVARRLLTSEPPGFPLLERLVEVAGPELGPVLLDALSSDRAESRPYWRKVFNLLVQVGRPVVPLIPDRLEDPRWFVRRNLLALLRELPDLPDGFSALPHLEDGEPQVRAEALPLGLAIGDERGEALRRGLADEDHRVVSLALSAAEAAHPPEIENRLAGLAGDGGRPDSHRIRAVRLLGDAEAEEALEVLLGLTWTRHWLFWRRLASPDRLMLEAVASLARGWADHPRAEEVLAAARDHDDERVRRAAADVGAPVSNGRDAARDRTDGEEEAA